MIKMKIKPTLLTKFNKSEVKDINKELADTQEKLSRLLRDIAKRTERNNENFPDEKGSPFGMHVLLSCQEFLTKAVREIDNFKDIPQ